jgi:predicted pyridoxine 5'-phosphate oxidase superfamily flavin-nucleotide-binding protein
MGINMSKKFYEKMFTGSVRQAQEQYGSRKAFERIESHQNERSFDGLSDAETDFIETRDGFYMATANEEGQPYIQFRGGPAGFLKVLGEKTLAFADFRGNLQYISVGNLKSNNQAALFLMDYARQRRLKLLVRVEVRDTSDVPDLMAKLESPGYKAKIERAMILHVEAFDWNCPQHIIQRFTMEEVKQMITPILKKIDELEAENQELRKNAGRSV